MVKVFVLFAFGSFLLLATSTHIALNSTMGAVHSLAPGQVVLLYYICAIIVALQTIPFRSVQISQPTPEHERRQRAKTGWMLSLSIAFLALPTVTFILVRQKGLTVGFWWLTYLEFFLFCGFWAFVSMTLTRIGTKPPLTLGLVYGGILLPVWLPFWFGPALKYWGDSSPVLSALLYFDPLFFAAKPLSMDILRFPIFYENTLLSQMYLRYPEPITGCILWGVLATLAGVIFVVVGFRARKQVIEQCQVV